MSSVPPVCPVWTEEEGGEGGGGEGGHGAGLRGLADPSQEGHPARLRRRGGGRGEHPGHGPQVPARTHTGHLQEVKGQTDGRTDPSSLAPIFVSGDSAGRLGLMVGGGVAQLLEAAHCLSRCSFLLCPRPFDLTKPLHFHISPSLRVFI